MDRNFRMLMQNTSTNIWQFNSQFRVGFFLATSVLVFLAAQVFSSPHTNTRVPTHISYAISRCHHIQKTLKTASHSDQPRTQSDRYVPGTKPVLLKHARIWTGEKNGTEVIHGDILLDNGLIKGTGYIPSSTLREYGGDLITMDIGNAFVTPGIVDMHSHIGVSAAPELSGSSEDYGSDLGNIQPFLRSLDGLNTLDRSYELSIAGGVTTALVLPGSGNAIGGQGFTIKLRNTAERSPTSMLLEPPNQINVSFPDPSLPFRWRQMKHACGENPGASYTGTRMDTIWALREAYSSARELMREQDAYCSKAAAGQFNNLGNFPDDLRWEALVDVLRGKVKVHIHCYEAVDLDDMVGLSNEFQFPIAAFHHASEAYLVPELLKKVYGGAPGIALFATNARYKREAYRSSEFAPKILAEKGIKVAMKSDHYVLNSRYLLYEAQQAYYYGLSAPLALASVTSTPSQLIGLDDRVGFIKPGWDADIVVWDSHPLALGATPSQVFVDGIPQLGSPHVIHKPGSFQKSPEVPDHSTEAEKAVEYDGLPPLGPKTVNAPLVLFKNVKNVFISANNAVLNQFSTSDSELGIVIVHNGSISCAGTRISCLVSDMSEVHVVDLKGGSISPGLISYGSPLGLEHIATEASTNDGIVHDPLVRPVPKVIGVDAIMHAVDGINFASRDALLAYRAGVTIGITAPTHSHFYSGLSTAFSLDAMHRLEEGAIIQDVAALHISVRHFGGRPTISTQIATLRRLLLDPPKGASARWFKSVIDGETPLVLNAHSIDVIVSLIQLKREIEKLKGNSIQMTITGASEAHAIAAELAEAGVGVILNPSRPFPAKWEDRKILPGPPLTELSAITELLRNNVTVGVGIEQIWSARNTRFDLAWVSIEGGGRISQEQVIALGSTNIAKLFGLVNLLDLVATEGGDILGMNSKVVAVITPRRNRVDIL